MLNPSFARPTPLYTGAPIQEYKALNADVADQYNTTKAGIDELDLLANNLKLRKQDSHIKQEVIDKLKTDFEETTKLGNYEDAKYKVAKAAKDFQMNNKLKAALEKKAAEDGYMSDLQSRLKKWQEGDKEGGIDERAYQYALIQSQKANDKPTEYDPNTFQDNNPYQGVKVMNDLSGTIQDDIMKQFEGFKETQKWLDSKGNEYKIDKAGPTERILKNGVEVTYKDLSESMKQYVENKEQYKAYLNQSRNIDKWGKTYDPKTGTNRNINLSDIDFLAPEKMKEIYVGATEDQMKQLANSKVLSDKHLYNQFKEREKSFDLNDPNVVNTIHDKFESDNQLNKIVYPAAEKYSYEKMNFNQFTDQSAKLALEDWYKRKAEERAATAIPPITEVENTTVYNGEDFKTFQTQLPTLKLQVEKIKGLLANPKTPPEMRQTYERQLIDAQNSYNQVNTKVQEFYNNVTPETKEKIKTDLVTLLGNSQKGDLTGGNQISAQFKTYLDSELPKLLVEAQSNQDWDAVRTINYAISNRKRNNGALDNSTIEALATTIAKNPNNFVRNLEENSNNPYSIEGTINSKIREHYTEKGLEEHPVRTYNVGDLGTKENAAEVNNVLATSQSLLNNSQNLMTPDGTPLNDVIANNTFWKLNEKGDEYIAVTPTSSKSRLSPNSPDISGRLSATVTFKDDKGDDIVMSKEKPDIGDQGKARASVMVYTPNSNAIEVLSGEMIKAARKAGQNQTADKIEAGVLFGSYNNKLRGGIDSPPITVNMNGKQLKIGLKKLDENHSIMVDPSGNPILPGDKGVFQGNKAADILYSIYRANQ